MAANDNRYTLTGKGWRAALAGDLAPLWADQRREGGD